MIVSELPDGELRRLLGRSGLRLRLGPIVANIASPFETVEAALALHYASHEVLPDSEFADFHVAVDPVPGLRRWIRPQAYFRFDANPPFNPLAASQAFPLLEWGLNWCISAHCHQYLIIHGAVVERARPRDRDARTAGIGKSTLCAALVARGWRLLSDELTLIDVETRRSSRCPRPISLKNESIRIIAEFWPEARMGPVVHDTLKGSVAHVRPPSASVQLADADGRPGLDRAAGIPRRGADGADTARQVDRVHAPRRERVQLQRARATRLRHPRGCGGGERLPRVPVWRTTQRRHRGLRRSRARSMKSYGMLGETLRDTDRAFTDPPHWDELVRRAREADLLGTLAHRFDASGRMVRRSARHRGSISSRRRCSALRSTGPSRAKCARSCAPSTALASR